MSRQARKEAAAAAQDMLKLDAARIRKPAASQSRKGAVAPMRKNQGGALAVCVPEHRSSGYGAASPPPSSFTDGSCFFNGATGGFFGNAGQSHVGQPWSSQSSDPATWYYL
ncbi:unnamed protein product [Urochloa humidicola]